MGTQTDARVMSVKDNVAMIEAVKPRAIILAKDYKQVPYFKQILNEFV